MPNPNPVIVVPGITASELRDEYPIDFERVWGIGTKDYLRTAIHPDDLRYEARQPARVVADRLFNLVYGEIIEELRHNLSPKADLPTPVYGFAYDWRQPLEITAAKLGQFIEEVTERTRLLPHYYRAGYGDDPKVNLVGHSLGGLIVAEYLAQSGSRNPIGKVATLGTPFRGSHEAVLKVATGTAAIGANTASSREREVARVTPALYYLAPSFPDAVVAEPGVGADLFLPETWQPSVVQSIKEYVRIYSLEKGALLPRAEELFRRLLTAACQQRQRLESLRLDQAGLAEEDWLAIIGVGEETRVRLQIQNDKGKPRFNLTGADRTNDWTPGDWVGKVQTGDGTVPYLGAKPSFVAPERLVCVCDDDFGYWELKDRFLEGIGVGLHATLPLMNGVQRLVASHFLGRAFGEVGGRPAPDIGVRTWNPPIKGLRQK